ncbi:MotA/TolQ/ExbB proton channel family protein [Vibrio sp. WXL210]|uniref:MotA/TolQ/ExbB proton channel family protein n=1 Tax=Vibrio sp. WXL210 TaxID=3450709 RepID=UPI003EC7D1AF
MIKKLFPILYIVPVLIVIFLFASQNGLTAYVDLISLYFVLVPTYLAGLVGSRHSRRTSIAGIFWGSMLSGLLGFLMGLIVNLSASYDDPAAALSFGLSVSLLPLFYGLTIGLLTLPFYLVARAES